MNRRIPWTFGSAAVVVLLGTSLSLVERAAKSAPIASIGLTADQVRVEFERFAAELPFFHVECVTYDQTAYPSVPLANSNPDHAPKATATDDSTHRRIMLAVQDRHYGVTDLTELLKHRDPKVRTLAMAALYDREDPRLLPLFQELIHDEAHTFDTHPDRVHLNTNLPKDDPNYFRQTVGDMAGELLLNYTRNMSPASHGDPRFPEYWQTHGSRKFCSGWYEIKLIRAGSIRKIRTEDDLRRIRAVRAEIDALPPDDRAWELLSMHRVDSKHPLAIEAELLDACRSLGREKLLQFLEGNIPSDDPDLHSDQNFQTYFMGEFILERATQLLQPEDADRLIAVKTKHRSLTLDVAAAELQPHRAEEILTAAINRSSKSSDAGRRAIYHKTLLRLEGEKHIPRIVEWFYTDGENPWAQMPYTLVDELSDLGTPAAKRTIAQIIRDDRFETHLDWYTLSHIERCTEQWQERPFISEIEFYKYLKRETTPFEMRAIREKIRGGIPKWLPAQ